jgi:pyridoxal phosphate enzyme (YggS family)
MGGMTISSFPERFAQLNDTIERLASGRVITTIAVSKYTDSEQIAAAFVAGFRHFGESRLQDALSKQKAFSPPELHWHFIGTLQSNKLGKSVGRFSLIHSVDSLEHARKLSEVNATTGQRQPCLLQINLSSDASRNGFSHVEVRASIEELIVLPGLAIEGLMAMSSSEQARTHNKIALEKTFESVRLLRDDLASRCEYPLSTLSMGMSRDYKEALKQGATMIRIGQAIFGPKDSTQIAG